MPTKFQIFPDLVPDEYESLKASIADNGVEVKIIVDQNGEIIDGFHRQKACDELKCFCPSETVQFASEHEKYELSLRLNCRRRQLNREQKRQLISTYLLRDPAINNNHLGEIIGVSKNTVADVRSELEATCQIDKLEELRGRDGKRRPKKYKRIVANTYKEAETALRIIGDLPDHCDGKTLDVTTAKRRANRQRNRRRRDAQQATITPLVVGDNSQIRHCRFQDLDVRPGEASFVLTDPPYGKFFLDQLTDLADFCEQVLKDGGLVAIYYGKIYLPELIRAFSGLTYRSTMACDFHRGGDYLAALNCVCGWKPIVLFSKGEWRPTKMWADVLRGAGREKQLHEWQQPIEEATTLLDYFSDPGDLVIDPCGGSFTTAEACLRLGRRCISCDCDPDAVAIGKKRIAEAVKDIEISA